MLKISAKKITGVIAAALIAGATLLPASAASAAAYPSCTSRGDGATAVATCAPNGEAFLFRVAARCTVDALNGTFHTQRFGPWTAPGGQSDVTCESAEHVTQTSVLVSG